MLARDQHTTYKRAKEYTYDTYTALNTYFYEPYRFSAVVVGIWRFFFGLGTNSYNPC